MTQRPLTMRRMLSGLAVAGTALLLSHAAQAEIKWTGGGINAPNAPATLGAFKFVDLVKERSGGELIIDYFEASKLGPANQQMEAISTGGQHLYISSGVAASNLVPEYGILDMAFLFRDHDHIQNFIDSDMRQELDQKLIDGFGIRVIAMNWFRMPRYYLHTSKFVLTPEDIKGVRVRTPNLPMHIQNWENMGAVPVKVAYQEQYLALSQGLVDMTEISGEQLYAMKLHEVAPYITDSFFAFPQASVFVNEAAYQALSEDLKTLVVQAAEDAGDWQSDLVRQRFQPEWEKVMAEGGKFKSMTPEQRAQFAALTEKSVPEMVEKGLIPEGWYSRIKALQ